MTPLDIIRNGILAGDMDMVANGYHTLTGAKVSPPPVAPRIKVVHDEGLLTVLANIKQICEGAIRQPTVLKIPEPEPPPLRLVTEDALPANTKAKEKNSATDQFRIQHKRPQQNIREDGKKSAIVLPFEPGMKNEFVDDGTLAVPTEAHLKFDELALPKQRVSQPRPPIQLIELVCSECGYKETCSNSTARLMDDEYKHICDACIGKRVK